MDYRALQQTYGWRFLRSADIQREETTILTEVPEMFGAETLLMNRCAKMNSYLNRRYI